MTAKAIELTSRNLRDYFAGLGLARNERIELIRELGGGVSNTVLLVQFAGSRWVVKQSLGRLRVQDDWRSDRERIFREAESIQFLQPLLEQALPTIIHIDRENYAYIMTAAPPGSVVWKDDLLQGRVDNKVARNAGTLLAALVNASRADRRGRGQLEERFKDRGVFDQLRIDPYYRTTATRHPDVQDALRDLIADSLKIRTALVHGDYSPKNMLVQDGQIFLIDFEVVHWGDPAFDAGFLLNHLLLKAFHQPRFAKRYISAGRDFWNALIEALEARSADDLEAMTIRHLGGLMLARIDGKSPVEYIRDDQTKNLVRRVAKRILLERPRGLDEVIRLAEAR